MGTWDVEIIDELAPASGEKVFYNWPFNVFEGTGLDEYLKDQGVETVVLTGVATGMSVGTAAWALAERFYNLIVPADASTDGNSEVHKVVVRVHTAGHRPGHHHGGRHRPSLITTGVTVMVELTHMFEPLRIGDLTIRNRFMVSPMVMNYCTADGDGDRDLHRLSRGEGQGRMGPHRDRGLRRRSGRQGLRRYRPGSGTTRRSPVRRN